MDIANTGEERLRWLDESSYLNSWNKRARFAARYCRSDWICDIGCGMQGLSRYLPLKTRYLPADLKSWTPEVEACDLNAGQLPDNYLAVADQVVMLGVVERIYDLDWLFSTLAKAAPKLVVTYNTTEFSPTRPKDWISAYSDDAFRTILEQNNYLIESAVRFRSQMVYAARSKAFADFAGKQAAQQASGFRTSWPAIGQRIRFLPFR